MSTRAPCRAYFRRYSVIETACLLPDLQLLPDEDLTEIGEKVEDRLRRSGRWALCPGEMRPSSFDVFSWIETVSSEFDRPYSFYQMLYGYPRDWSSDLHMLTLLGRILSIFGKDIDSIDNQLLHESSVAAYRTLRLRKLTGDPVIVTPSSVMGSIVIVSILEPHFVIAVFFIAATTVNMSRVIYGPRIGNGRTQLEMLAAHMFGSHDATIEIGDTEDESVLLQAQ
ncbi:hypothetical protein BDR04DRAFT_1123084 [Suillus decipiens]|nr:hypothetical protein BDR04DRAFT_1123084 [Suillus decipiens]